ncbi:MAG: VOC family protein [Oscillochloris sp.]|nr:VOC family protein [Oscillochloris sp.]
MELGSFSISLTVKDLAASRAFYERLGFEVFDGDPAHNWLMMRNGSAKIGLFHGMFEQNIITFNPPDVRAIQREVKAAGGTFVKEADEAGSGPDHATMLDPDGNPILLDQFAE